MKTIDRKPAPGKHLSFADRIRRAFMAKDSDQMEQLAQEVEDEAGDPAAAGGGASPAAAKLDNQLDQEAITRLSKLEAAVTAIAAKIDAMGATGDADPSATTAAADPTSDPSADPATDPTDTQDEVLGAEPAEKLNQAETDLYTGDSAKQILSRAEILSPGIKLPTLDARMSTKDRAGHLCACQRRALEAAMATDAGRQAIAPFVGKTTDMNKLPAMLVNAAFMGASELMRRANNGVGTALAVSRTKDFGHVVTPAEINKRNREFWAQRAGK